MEYILIILFFGGILLINSLSWGLVFFKFYYWFITPVFGFGMLPDITLVQAIGVMMVINLFKSHSADSLKEELYAHSAWDRVLMGLFSPWVTLLIGWGIKLVFLS